MAPAVKSIVCSVAVIAAIAAVLSVSHTPAADSESATSSKQKAEQRQDQGSQIKADLEPTDSDFFRKAHRQSLDDVIREVETLAPTVAPWEVLQSGQKLQGPGLSLSSHIRATQEKRPWQRLARELYAIDKAQLDHEGKILYPTAAYWIERSLFTPEFKDPLAPLARVEQIVQGLTGELSRNRSVASWRPAVEATANALDTAPLPSGLHPQEQAAVRSLWALLDARLQRWLRSDRLPWITPHWRRTLALLQDKLSEYKNRALDKAVQSERMQLRRKDFEQALGWELGHTATTPETLQAISYSQNKIHALRQKIQTPASRKSRSTPSAAECIGRQDELRALLGKDNNWIEAQLSCELLLELAPFADLDALSLALIDEGWIEPTRSEVRWSQRTLVAALASQWRPQVHRQMRRIMLLYPLLQKNGDPQQGAWLNRIYRRTLDELWDQLCWGQQQLGSLLSTQEARELPPKHPSCIKAQAPSHYSSMIRALVSAHSGTLPATRAIMAGLDRFYWGPTRVALYWSAPAGVEPVSYGRNRRVAAPKPETQLTPLRHHAEPRTAPTPSRNP